MKENKKMYMLHHVGIEDSFQMDIMYDNVNNIQYAWLVLINITTRKLCAEEINVGGIEKKYDAVIYPAFVTIISKIQQKEPITIIRCDHEQAFKTLNVADYLIRQNIILLPVQKFDGHSHHTALAFVDREIRTLRDKATKDQVLTTSRNQANNDIQKAVQLYNTRLKDVGLVPLGVIRYVDEYNNAPHSFLSKILDKRTSPNQVTAAEENIIRDAVTEMNYQVKHRNGYSVTQGKHVDIERNFNPYDKHDRISAYEEGLVNCRIGSYYSVDYGTYTHLVPRWQLTNPK
jgi:hypothetical protein